MKDRVYRRKEGGCVVQCVIDETSAVILQKLRKVSGGSLGDVLFACTRLAWAASTAGGDNKGGAAVLNVKKSEDGATAVVDTLGSVVKKLTKGKRPCTRRRWSPRLADRVAVATIDCEANRTGGERVRRAKG